MPRGSTPLAFHTLEYLGPGGPDAEPPDLTGALDDAAMVLRWSYRISPELEGLARELANQLLELRRAATAPARRELVTAIARTRARLEQVAALMEAVVRQAGPDLAEGDLRRRTAEQTAAALTHAARLEDAIGRGELEQAEQERVQLLGDIQQVTTWLEQVGPLLASEAARSPDASAATATQEGPEFEPAASWEAESPSDEKRVVRSSEEFRAMVGDRYLEPDFGAYEVVMFELWSDDSGPRIWWVAQSEGTIVVGYGTNQYCCQGTPPPPPQVRRVLLRLPTAASMRPVELRPCATPCDCDGAVGDIP